MEVLDDASMNEDLQQQALQDFVVGNRDLAELEALAKRFNVFETLGVVRDERKHSKFLGFLLDPGASHGLSDRFLKRILQAALEIGPSVASLTPLDIDLFDLSHAEVQIERSGIDIFVRDAQNRICVILENKVDSTEHSDQLSKYYRLTSERYPKSTIFGIYLTIEGELPEKEEDRQHYAPMSHSAIRETLGRLSEAPDLRIENDVRFAVDQYMEVLGRHFMADEQIKRLCDKIYKQHRQAIDIIISNLPNQRAAARDKLIELIEANKSLILDDCSGTYVRFISKPLDIPYFGGGWGWTTSKRFLLFEFQITQKSIVLIIQMGPGEADRRKHIHGFLRTETNTFQVESRFYEKWQSLYRKPIVETLDGDIDHDQLIQTLETKWEEFLEDDLPSIEQTFLAHQWPSIVGKV